MYTCVLILTVRVSCPIRKGWSDSANVSIMYVTSTLQAVHTPMDVTVWYVYRMYIVNTRIP